MQEHDFEQLRDEHKSAAKVTMPTDVKQQIYQKIAKDKSVTVKRRPNRRRTAWTSVAAAAAAVALVGGGFVVYTHQGTVSKSSLGSHQKGTTQKGATATTRAVKNVVVANTALPGYSGQRIQLVDVKGKYVDNKTPGPYPEGSAWTGKFALRVVGPSGKPFSNYPLPNFYRRFSGKFQIHFADYNGNGRSDFALGQYMSSNGYNYELFKVGASGITPMKTIPAQIFTVDHSYSPLFHKVAPNSFVVQDYNNATAKYEIFTFVWKNGEFKISHKQTSNTPINLSTYH